MLRLTLALLVAALCSSSLARAEEPAPKGEPLPLPRPVSSNLFSYYLPSSLPQPGTREIWQYYGVDSTGRFRARVILSPLGAYYLYNGEPYPWTTTRPLSHMPYALD